MRSQPYILFDDKSNFLGWYGSLDEAHAWLRDNPTKRARLFAVRGEGLESVADYKDGKETKSRESEQ